MRPDVIVHIGPPKTGTTSLQVAFDSVAHPDFFYAGTFQPRSRNTGSLCQKLYHACSAKSENSINTSELLDELGNLKRAGKTILFSEEMFLLEQQEISIEEKIFILKRLLHGFNCRILISARSGQSALPSLYQEIFQSLPFKLKTDFAAFCRDRRALCYDYAGVCDMLLKSGFDDIVVFEFDDLSKQNLNLGALTACDDFKDCNLSAQHLNVGLSGGGGSERTLPRISLKSFGDSSVIKSLIKSLNMRKWPGYRKLTNILDIIEISPSGNRNLSVPHDVVFHLEAAYNEAIDRFGQKPLKEGVDSN